MSYALTESQLNDFRTNGFLKIEQAVPAGLLRELQAFTDELLQREPPQEQFLFLELGGKNFLAGVDQLCMQGNGAALALLGSGVLLDRAASVCGTDLFPVQEFAVIKNRGDDNRVLWHQDVPSRFSGNTCMIGIYLDEARAGEGALRVIPGSHRSGAHICELQQQPATDVPMQPGDMLIHDLMLAHSSGVLQNQERRRVLYFEFLPAAETIREKLFTAENVALKIRLQALAIAYNKIRNGIPHHFSWTHSDVYGFDADTPFPAETAAIYEQHFKLKVANYCLGHFAQGAGSGTAPVY